MGKDQDCDINSRVKVLPWPLQFPDLIVLKSCGVISKTVHARKSTNIAQLEKYCLEKWVKIPAK